MALHTIATEEEFQTLVIEAGKPVLVDFWAPWCGPCKMIAPELESLAPEYADKAAIIKVNVDDFSAVAQRYKVMGIPTLLIFKEGKEVSRLVGFRPKKELAAALDAVL